MEGRGKDGGKDRDGVERGKRQLEREKKTFSRNGSEWWASLAWVRSSEVRDAEFRRSRKLTMRE